MTLGSNEGFAQSEARKSYPVRRELIPSGIVAIVCATLSQAAL